MFTIDLMSRTPVYEQIMDQMEMFILKGILKSGDQIPSVRSLSVELSINPNTIQKAYSQLDQRGIISTVPGRGSFISDDAKQRLRGIARKQLDDLRQLAQELALAGISKEEVYQVINEVF